MIALGIAPGLHALAYSVLSYQDGRLQAELVDADTLHAGRSGKPKDAIEVLRRCRPHQLVLDVVLDRNPPAIITLGPQAEAKEPPEHIAIVRMVLVALGQTFNVPVIDLNDPEALYRALGIEGARGLSGCLREAIAGPNAVPRDKRIVLAHAAAVAGARSRGR